MFKNKIRGREKSKIEKLLSISFNLELYDRIKEI